MIVLMRCRLSRVEVLDEHHLVTFLAVDHLVHQFAGEQNAVSAGSKALSITVGNVTERVLERIGNRGVRDLIQREAATGVFDAASYSATRPEIPYFDVF